MKPLYETNIKYTIEEYKKYCNALNKKSNKVILIFSVMFLIFGILSKQLILIILGIVYYPLLKYVAINLWIKSFVSNKLTFNKEVHYEFYENYFITTTDNTENKVEYSGLYKVIETKDSIYMMIGARQGFLLLKKNFPKGLEEFLKKKTVNIKR